MSQTKTDKELRRKKKQKKEIVIGVVVIGIALFGTFGLFAILKVALNTSIPLVVVTSPSMVPKIQVGDLLIVGNKNPADIINGTHEDQTGDIIIYDPAGLGWPDYQYEATDGEPIVHRVVGKELINGTYYFETQGDANSLPDPPGGPMTIWVPQSHILGVVLSIIPKVGYVKIWLSDNNLAIPIIVILGLLLIISIAWDITHPEEDKEDKKKKSELVKEETPEEPKQYDMGT